MDWTALVPSLIITVVTAGVGYLTAYKPMKANLDKAKSDIAAQNATAEKTRTDILAQYMNVTQAAGKEVETKSAIIAKLEARIDALETHQAELEEEIHKSHLIIRQLQEHNGELTKQVKTLGGIPVKIGTGPLNGLP